MNNYPPWYNSLTNIQSGLSFGANGANDSNQTNHNYGQIANICLTQYFQAVALGIQNVGMAYSLDAMCTIHIIANGSDVAHEAVGFNAFHAKFTSLQIFAMHFKNIKFTPQPIGKTSIVISFCGVVEINGIDYSFYSSMLIKTTNGGNCRITSHTLSILV